MQACSDALAVRAGRHYADTSAVDEVSDESDDEGSTVSEPAVRQQSAAAQPQASRSAPMTPRLNGGATLSTSTSEAASLLVCARLRCWQHASRPPAPLVWDAHAHGQALLASRVWALVSACPVGAESAARQLQGDSASVPGMPQKRRSRKQRFKENQARPSRPHQPPASACPGQTRPAGCRLQWQLSPTEQPPRQALQSAQDGQGGHGHPTGPRRRSAKRRRQPCWCTRWPS